MTIWKLARLSRNDATGIETVSRWTFDAWGRRLDTTFDQWLDETRKDCGTGGVPSVFVAVSDGEPIATASLTSFQAPLDGSISTRSITFCATSISGLL